MNLGIRQTAVRKIITYLWTIAYNNFTRTFGILRQKPPNWILFIIFTKEVGIGNRSALLAAKQLAKLNDRTNKTATIEPNLHPTILPLQGLEGIVVIYAKCCRPIPGDPIGGYIKPGHVSWYMLKIALLREYQQDPDKYVSLHWEKNVQVIFQLI